MTWKEQLQHLCKECSVITNQQIRSLLPEGHLLTFEEHM